MSEIEKQSQIPDMYELRHKHDTKNHSDFSYDYSDNLIKNSVSKFIISNDKMKEYTNYISKIISIMVDSTFEFRNMFLYSHSKYYNKNGK